MHEAGGRHVAPLTRYVEELPLDTDFAGLVPYFDPLDGGTWYRCLFLFEAAGPDAVASRFVSCNNDDESAKNFLELNKDVRPDRTCTASWSIVPWYLLTTAQ
jgi:hypothetical protein